MVSQPNVRQRPAARRAAEAFREEVRKPSPTRKLGEVSKKPTEEKRVDTPEKEEEENRKQRSILGDIMVAQKSMLEKESRVVSSDAVSQDTKDPIKEHHSEDRKRSADPVKAEEIKRVRRPAVEPAKAEEPKPGATKKPNETWKKQREEKQKRASEKAAEEKGRQDSVLGNIMDAQKSMLKRESRVVNSDAMSQDMLDRYQDYHGEEIRRSADPVKAEELKPPSGNFSYRNEFVIQVCRKF